MKKSEADPAGNSSDSSSENAEATRLMIKGRLQLHISAARGLKNKDWFGISDPYVVVYLGESRIVKTKVIPRELNPEWSENFVVDVLGEYSFIKLSVKDKDIGSVSKTIGSCFVDINRLIRGEVIDGWHQLSDGKKIVGDIYFVLEYKPHTVEANHFEVPNTYFKMRTHCRVTPYQDACVEEGTNASIGMPHRDVSCWRDLRQRLLESKKLIYVIGWSVWVDTLLARDIENEETFGELLVKKANEGVNVLVLIWDEKFSGRLLPAGMLGTHDEYTSKYFASTKVVCCKLYRPRGEWTGNIGTIMKDLLFTHHQKTICVDIPGGAGGRRRLGAFIGGLDVADGRWDRPSHDVFRSLQTQHATDFHNALGKGIRQETGPREPWHDIHAFVEGQIANDILLNFQERWMRQVDKRDQKFFKTGDELNLDMSGHIEIHPEDAWNCQLFRSVDVRAAVFMRREGLHSTSFKIPGGLHLKSGRLVDSSIQKAYIHHIRRAKRFIYIENQYFIGSSQFWSPAKPGADNLIPAELGYKAADMIKQGLPFHIYLVIPMWPEGLPRDKAVQEVLQWQFRSISTVCRIVGNAIKLFGSKASVTDYVTFYCLGNRETHLDSQATEELNVTQPQNDFLAHRRTPIYVHSKMILIDDEYLLIGSANINQRSMTGTRDTEIAVGSYQPAFISDTANPKGEVGQFRLCLWLEHLGPSAVHAHGISKFDNPESPETVRLVAEIARKNWDIYVSPETNDLDGHLLPYPPYFGSLGNVLSKPGFDHFPDTNALVTGKNSTYVPNLLSM